MIKKTLFIAARIIAAFIMIQTLYFKLTGAEESIYIFKTVGMEPWGRYGVGFAELIASICILYPRTAWFGGLMTTGLMLGAIMLHIIFLGVILFNDGGQLFIYSCIAFICGLYTLFHDKQIALADMSRFKG